MKKTLSALTAAFIPLSAQAHFLLLKPSTDIVEESSAKKIEVKAIFTHPMLCPKFR